MIYWKGHKFSLYHASMWLPPRYLLQNSCFQQQKHLTLLGVHQNTKTMGWCAVTAVVVLHVGFPPTYLLTNWTSLNAASTIRWGNREISEWTGRRPGLAKSPEETDSSTSVSKRMPLQGAAAVTGTAWIWLVCFGWVFFTLEKSSPFSFQALFILFQVYYVKIWEMNEWRKSLQITLFQRINKYECTS